LSTPSKTPAAKEKPSKKAAAKQQREELLATSRKKDLPADPLSSFNLRSLGLRVGIPLAVVWVISFLISGWIPKAVAGVVTLGLAGVIFWVVRFARRSRAVAQIVQNADTPEARKDAIAKLETDFKEGDTAALFAKAQLQLQENPREALKTLEKIQLEKELATVADEARAQRAMIHLLLGETEPAKQLADGIDLSRHKEDKTRATLTAIIGEAWARKGQAAKAVELLDKIDLDDAVYKDLAPQLLRAKAFAFAWSNNTKQMKVTLRRLGAMNIQYLTGFVTNKKHPAGVPPKGVHPLLEKEAMEIIGRSGTMPRKMEYRRG
jgi:hypothetical protein